MSTLNLYQTSYLARSIVKEAGDQLRLEWKMAKEASHKDVRDIATQYDRLVEARITQALEKLFPGHSIYGEEATKTSKHSDYAWYIDPIDGTKYFASDIPLFTVSLGLTHKDEPILGVVYNPISEQMYSGYQGGSAQVNYDSIKVAKTRPMNELIFYADLSKFEQLSPSQQNWIKDKYFSVIGQTYRVRAFGCGSLGLCWIATGAFDAFIDFTGRTKFFDVCAGAAILHAAGGTYEYFDSGHGRLFLAASNPQTLTTIKELLA